MRLISKILGVLKKILPLVGLSRMLSSGARRVSYALHWLQFNIEWGADNPEYFDHQMDIHYQWRKTGNSLPMERGVHSSLALVGGGSTLDLACGDGFFSNYFYALKSKSVLGIDFDKSAVRLANSNRILPNTRFVLGDIRSDIPDGPFDNVVWDAAIEHFTVGEIQELVARIKQVLVPGGILSGYTVTEAEDGHKHLHQHEYEFHDEADLARFLEPHFKNVHVYSSEFPTRTNLYFYATDGKLPIDSSRHLIRRA